MLVDIDELYDLALKAKDDPCGHPTTQVLDNFDNFRCLLTPSLLVELITSLREADKDAARYRWLRDVGCFEGSADDLFHATPAETDAEFDRFMQCEQ